MSKQDCLHALLDALSPIVRPAMLEHFREDCCIATCRILREVLAAYGYKAREVPVTVQVLNGPMQKLVDEGPLPDDRAERVALFHQRGAWGVGIGLAHPGDPIVPGKYYGHLVLSVNGLLVDASLQQAQREQRGIVLPSLLWCRPEQGFFAKSKGQQTRGTVGECLVSYRRLRDDSYLTSKNWRAKYAGYPQIYTKIMRMLLEQGIK
jgi:hypothetical protein